MCKVAANARHVCCQDARAAYSHERPKATSFWRAFPALFSPLTMLFSSIRISQKRLKTIPLGLYTQHCKNMALYQRPSYASGKAVHSRDSSGPSAPEQSTSKQQLLTAKQLPSWYAHNTFLLTGYHPVNGSVQQCVDSIPHVHNETVNIWTHLVSDVAALVGNYVLHRDFNTHHPAAPLMDRLAIHLYLTTSLLCFGISSIYHTLNCHSEVYSSLWAQWDYAAIILQTVGSFASGIYVTFYCDPRPQRIYWTIVSRSS